MFIQLLKKFLGIYSIWNFIAMFKKERLKHGRIVSHLYLLLCKGIIIGVTGKAYTVGVWEEGER